MNIARILGVRGGEWSRVGLLFGLTLLLAAGSATGQSALDGLLLAGFGAGPLPYLYAGLGVAGILTTLGVTALIARGNRGRLYVRLALGLAVLELVVRGGLAILPAAFVVVAWLLLNAAAGLQGLIGWGLAGLVCDTREAKRLFPLFAAGGVLGSVAGGIATAPAAALLHSANLLVAWAAASVAAFGLGLVLLRHVRGEPPPDPGRSFAADTREGWQAVRASPMLAWLLAASVLFSMLYFALALPLSQAAALEFRRADDLAAFFGRLGAVSTGAAFLVSLFAAARIFRRIGLMGSILVFALVYLAGFAAVLVFPGLWPLAVFRVLQTVWLAGVAGTAYHAAFNVVPGRRRDQAREFVDGIGTQAGTILGGLTLAAGAALGARPLFAAGAAAAALTAFCVRRSGRHYAGALRTALRERRPEVLSGGAAPSQWTARVDPGAAEAIRLAAADADPRVRALAVEAAGATGEEAGVSRLLDDPDPAVRVAAARALREITVLEREARAHNGRSRVAALRALALLAPATAADAAARILAEEADPPSRAAALRALPPGSAIALAGSELGAAPAVVRRAAGDVLAATEEGVQHLRAALGAPPSARAAAIALERRGLSGGPMAGAIAERESRRALELAPFATADAASPESMLLRDSCLRRAREAGRHALVAATLGRPGYAAATAALAGPDPEQWANALELLEPVASAAGVAGVLPLWEPPEAGTPVAAPSRLAADSDPWLRACAWAAGGYSSPVSGAPPPEVTRETFERVLLLRRSALLEELDGGDLLELANRAAVREYRDGATIVREGDPGEELMIIESGAVEVVAAGAAIARRGPGDSVGEMAVLTGEPRSATLVARGPVRVLCIDRAQIESMLEARPEVAMSIIRTLARRLRERG